MKSFLKRYWAWQTGADAPNHDPNRSLLWNTLHIYFDRWYYAFIPYLIACACIFLLSCVYALLLGLSFVVH